MPGPSYLNPTSRMRSALFVYVSGVRTLFLDGVTQGAATSLVVPAGVSEMLFSGAGGGGGGGGGFATAGGGGGGGGAGMSVRDVPVIVEPGSTLTVTIGGSGGGGTVGNAGSAGGLTRISGFLFMAVPIPIASGTITPGSALPEVQLWPGNGGAAGAAVNGGNGGGSSYANGGTGGTGGAGAGGAGVFAGSDAFFFQGSGGGAGGAVNFGGGISTTSSNGSLVPGAYSGSQAGTVSNGGGGNGGTNFFSGINGHGRGGNANTPTAATQGIWGGGGGGGSGNNIGREGGDGFVLLRWVSPW